MFLSKIINVTLWFSTLLFLSLSSAWAALPTVDKPQSGSDGTLYGDIKGYSQDGILLGGLILAAIAFIVVAMAAVSSFKEAQEMGKWGKFATVVVVGVILIVVVIWMAAKASGILV